MKKYEICIKVDTNDADYNIAITKITQEVLDKIKPLVKAIKKKTEEHSKELGHFCNYPFGEYADDDPQRMYPDIDEEVFELFQDHCPYSEHGFHTIKMVVVYPLPIPNKERLL